MSNLIKRQNKISKGNLKCSYCPAENLDPNHNNIYSKILRKKATIDHIISLSKGGEKFDEDNMCVACVGCNRVKKDKDSNTFIAERHPLNL